VAGLTIQSRRLLRPRPRYKARVSDTFTRDDGLLSVGVSDSGHSWITDSSHLSVVSNQCAAVDTGYRRSHITGLKPDGILQVTLATASATSRQIFEFRYSNGSNFFRCGTIANVWTLTKVEGGSETSLGTGSGTPTSGDVLKVILIGESISFYVNNVLKVAVTSSLNVTTGRHGLVISGTTAPRLDNFTWRQAA
jgi:hypothetical protein